ncbi:DUF2779 domain-containing protein [Treponema sp. Marseille-Q4132]|uniref:DUF2779 domain-containing protein n=1 Tax=Treponema sp. Marseille-Q4132 TaxID=2766701 RepID=UPI0016532767|nr:DUF2779 domain-containing protein [Treponema sp. Marseille-Q4132]QNL98222.1 DUF2779 domain-containing protein [Treponema sp. Marseille-Q4132]
MREYHFSKFRYCCGIQCPKILWLKENMPDEFDAGVMNPVILSTGNDVGDLAMGLFGDYTEVPFTKKLGDMIPATQKFIEDAVRNICEASFSFDGCFCSVDILRNLGNKKVAFYEVKSSTGVRWIYEHDISYQYYVLTKLGYDVQKACLVHINNQYVRHGELELDKLFSIVDLTETVKEKLGEVEENIKKFREYLKNETEPECKIGCQCSDPYECGYWSHCASDMPQDNSHTVWEVASLRNKQWYYDNGYVTFEQLYDAGILEGKYLQQIEVEIKDLPPQIDKPQIKKFLSTLSYPLYFLDFETFNPAVPLYDNSSPYQQIVFQYSLHYIEKEGAVLKHKECLAYPGSDPRRQIAKQLCRDIPPDACTAAYNMGFEKGQIRALADLYPDLHDHLMNIHDNIKDIMLPFRKRWYYTKEMQGSYSIKYVLPALFPDEPGLNYHNLEGVHNGSEASNVFFAMQKMDKKELGEWREHLLRYCELDTFAMVKILEKLREAVE